MTNQNNIGAAVSEAVASLLTPEFIEKQVNARVEKLVTEAVDSALRSYSDTGKMITKAVEDALRVDRIDLPSYGQTVAKMLKAQIESRVSDLVAGKLAMDMEELLSLAPKEVKLSEISSAMLERREDEYGPCITVIVHRSEYGSTWLHLDEDNHYDEHDRHKADIQLLLSDDGTIFDAKIHGRSMKDARHFGRAYGLEQKLRAYSACGTKIILDEDYVSISKGDY